MTLLLMMKGRVAERIRLSGSWCLFARFYPRVPRGAANIIAGSSRLQRLHSMLISYSRHQYDLLLQGVAWGGRGEETWSCYLTKKKKKIDAGLRIRPDNRWNLSVPFWRTYFLTKTKVHKIYFYTKPHTILLPCIKLNITLSYNKIT
jgi:hypothetical protein